MKWILLLLFCSLLLIFSYRTVQGSWNYSPMLVSGGNWFGEIDTPADRVDSNILVSPFSGVASIQSVHEGGSSIGTGVLVGSNIVLTAAHILDRNGDGVVDDGIVTTVFFNLTGDLSHSYSVSEVVLYPDYSGFGDTSLTGDLAILKLSQTVAEPIQRYPISEEKQTVGANVTLVGYGMSGDGVSGYQIDASLMTKRFGENLIDMIYHVDDASGFPHLFQYDFDHPSTFGIVDGSLGLERESIIGPGDSGGPVFSLGYDGYELVGISTFAVGEATGFFGSRAGGLLIAPYNHWIGSFVTIPEPGFYGLISGLFIMVSVLCRRF
jgi:V8-like Glu-specific endopeptidase